ncbi:glycoside hydrolase family 95 protein [Caulobacter sp. 1776]|uniref:glycoside hydrolase family 95 protein n=1 Tax=Caulobacter sp. 1776 TaxID=3156420 RepID=UPI003390F19F
MRAIVLAFGIAMGAQANAAEQAHPAHGSPQEKPMRLWYRSPAADSVQGWLDQSLPLGNGYFGVNVFGGVARERLQVTENSLVDTPANGIGGLNNFAEVALEFPHATPQDYSRDLDLNTATAHVRYSHDGVTFTREYFTSYPDRVMVIRLAASRPGALDFTLRPRAPYLAPFRRTEDDRRGKHATASARGDLITLSGVMDYYGIKFEAQFKVIPQGGVLNANNDGGEGSISVHRADSAVILMALGTNYRLDPQVFSEKDPLAKLKGFPDPHQQVSATLNAAARRPFGVLKARHLADYGALYGRAAFDLGGPTPSLPTDQVLDAARKGESEPYLEELGFQLGRYLLISSSRKGALPPNLQGVWNVYQDAPWSSGYWHNVNQQMNYWPAFVNNLPELFDSYIDFYKAYLPAHRARATEYLKAYHPTGLSADGDDGWALGNSMRPLEPSGKVAHSGFGTGPWTTMLFWDRYDFTRDKTLLREVVYPAMRGQANFLSRFLTEKDGKFLAAPSSSPENAASLQSVGTTFDQQMIFENYRDTVAAAGLLGVSNDPVIARINAQKDKLDPIRIGASGQIKEYQEETTYGSIGDPKHRHISQLLGVYPGRLITSDTPAWRDAAKVSLRGRGSVGGTGWAQAERMLTWARLGDGDTAYYFYRYWLTHHAMSNLWNNHRDSLTTKLFQVDGNFGVSAGVGEMLLQSADGVIAPLAALPSSWREGHYRGLLARGAFEVSADWSNGHADRFEILSKVGGPLTLRYPGIALAKIRTAKGASVSVRPDARGDVSFDTAPGVTYVVTSIPPASVSPLTEDLKIAADRYETVLLSWRADPRFKAYAVERAVGDAPAYEQIANGLSQSQYVDEDATVGAVQHLRYRVIGVTAAGERVASEGIFRNRPERDAVGRLRPVDDLPYRPEGAR